MAAPPLDERAVADAVDAMMDDDDPQEGEILSRWLLRERGRLMRREVEVACREASVAVYWQQLASNSGIGYALPIASAPLASLPEPAPVAAPPPRPRWSDTVEDDATVPPTPHVPPPSAKPWSTRKSSRS